MPTTTDGPTRPSLRTRTCTYGKRGVGGPNVLAENTSPWDRRESG
ncbi:hypothetical protein [Streptomyces sp. NPDC058625]